MILEPTFLFGRVPGHPGIHIGLGGFLVVIFALAFNSFEPCTKSIAFEAAPSASLIPAGVFLSELVTALTMGVEVRRCRMLPKEPG